jgi:hypothetical protein
LAEAVPAVAVISDAPGVAAGPGPAPVQAASSVTSTAEKSARRMPSIMRPTGDERPRFPGQVRLYDGRLVPGGPFVTDSPALEILRTGARALASGGDLETALGPLLRVVADELDISSAAVFVAEDGRLAIAASIGVGDPAALAAAVRNPAHPVARAVGERVSAFDVRPMAPGGPALRSHLLLTVDRDGSPVVLGVLALAHEGPTDLERRSILQAVGDLVAVAVERDRARS